MYKFYILCLLLSYATCYEINTLSLRTYEGTDRLQHGEGPHWDEDLQALYWVDVAGHNIYRMMYRTGRIDVRHIEYGEVNVVTPVANSSKVLVTVRAQVFLLDWETGEHDSALQFLAAVDIGRPSNVLNDGKADALGRFWAGSKGRQSGSDVNPDESALYMISQQNFQHPEIKIKPVSISNGLCWSHDNTVFYYVDSPSYQVAAYDFDLETGHISERHVVIDIRDYGYTGIPDGMTIDADGNLWVAIMFDGTVLHVDSKDGHVIGTYTLPAKRTTSVMWGGPNFDILYVTSSSTSLSQDELREQPMAGSIFTITNTGFRGVPTHKFKFNHDLY